LANVADQYWEDRTRLELEVWTMNATKQKRITKSDLDTALAFAKVEILELQAGKRFLHQCPGLEKVNKFIKQFKKSLKDTVE
jgi:hypothetical protein